MLEVIKNNLKEFNSFNFIHEFLNKRGIHINIIPHFQDDSFQKVNVPRFPRFFIKVVK